MMIDFIDSKALLQASVQEELYENLVSQIVKDCALANSPIDLPFKVSPQNLKTILHQKVYRLITDCFAKCPFEPLIKKEILKKYFFNRILMKIFIIINFH